MNKKRNKKWKESRYNRYYEKTMEPIRKQQWETDLKRLKILRKDVLGLGPIPTRQIQLIKTTNYFIKFMDLLTEFHDNGMLKCAPESKAQEVRDFNDIISTFVAREKCTNCYHNRSEVGKRVTANNLYLGLFVPITDEDDLEQIQTKVINGKKLKVEVDFCPLYEWLNKRAVTIDGHRATISQKFLAKFLNEMRSIVLEVIDGVLEE